VTLALLDVNVLLAPLAVTTSITAGPTTGSKAGSRTGGHHARENGFVRIISQPRYPSPITPSEAIDLLKRACDSGNH